MFKHNIIIRDLLIMVKEILPQRLNYIYSRLGPYLYFYIDKTTCKKDILINYIYEWSNRYPTLNVYALDYNAVPKCYIDISIYNKNKIFLIYEGKQRYEVNISDKEEINKIFIMCVIYHNEKHDRCAANIGRIRMRSQTKSLNIKIEDEKYSKRLMVRVKKTLSKKIDLDTEIMKINNPHSDFCITNKIHQQNMSLSNKQFVYQVTNNLKNYESCDKIQPITNKISSKASNRLTKTDIKLNDKYEFSSNKSNKYSFVIDKRKEPKHNYQIQQMSKENSNLQKITNDSIEIEEKSSQNSASKNIKIKKIHFQIERLWALITKEQDTNNNNNIVNLYDHENQKA